MKFNFTTMLSENISKTAEGFLVCKNVPLARPGELVYANTELPGFEAANGRIVASRDAADILDPETMASFEGKTLSFLHPKEQEINSTNWKTHAVGTIFNVRAGDGANVNLLVSDILINDAQAVEAVMNRGLREVSLGYEAQYFQEAKGRVRQKNIRGNHVALVPRGRCGALCAIQDHAAFLPTEKETMTAKEKLIAFFTKAVNDGELEDEGKQSTTTTDKALETLTDTVGKLTTDMATIATGLTKVVDALADIKKEKEGESKTVETADAKAAREKLEKEELEKKPNTVADADTFALAEILAPGVQNSATVKVDALKAAYKTTDGKKVIEMFTFGKEVDYNSANAVDVAFVGAAHMLKNIRVNDSASTKAVTIDQLSLHKPKADTPATVQARVDEFWKKQA